MISRTRIAALSAFLVGIVSSYSSAAVLPVVTLTTQLSQSTLHVGDTVTATISATVSNAASTNGIISYDLDLFPLNGLQIHFVGAASQTPGSSVLSGTLDPTTGGLLGIIGEFSAPGVGVGSTVQLFTVQVHADAISNSNSVSAGLSVQPGGVGLPFILATSGDFGTGTFTVDTSGAVAPLTVVAGSAPEPSTGVVTLGALAVMAAWNSRRTNRRLSPARA